MLSTLSDLFSHAVVQVVLLAAGAAIVLALDDEGN